ncbi:hypothetical protein [Ornithinimicrobium cerasi]|uniref:Uncharacterized protein n=1 Tax=Ornithinimicrobium cerasi TaxID=2248773 RepID=A0A285VKN0_9MICO|nr:hypothetical protein [Ornithinimicrobium cerasi]SOC53746.1 hypothetical protein SAMN05421879_102104 [Ornithinimicrobium cerasi]
MSTQIVSSAPLVSSRTALAGDLTLAAGVLGAVAGAALALWPREVSPDQFSYPLGTVSHVAFQLFFTVHHLGLLAGLLTLGVLARPVATRVTRAGTGLAVAGMVLLTVMEAAVAFLGLGITVDSARGQLLGSLYGVASLMIGAGLVAAGVGLVRRPVLPGLGRYLPLALGVWVFVPMVPALFAPMVWGRLAIIGWMVLFALLGMQLRRVARDAARG